MANQTVTRIEQGFMDQSRFPFALARLSCNHLARVELLPVKYKCTTCGLVTLSNEPCVCGGRWSHTYEFSPYAHNPEHQVTKVGDVVNCKECDKEAAQLEWLRALPREIVQHARYRTFCGSGSYYFYQRDATSPTGVRLAGSVVATPEVDAVLREKRISPLSPTESLSQNGPI